VADKFTHSVGCGVVTAAQAAIAWCCCQFACKLFAFSVDSILTAMNGGDSREYNSW